MDKLKKRIILEFIIICMCISVMTIYIMGLIVPNIYFSDFLLSTIQVIFTGGIMILVLPLYFHDLKIADEKNEIIITTKSIKQFWSYCITISGIISIVSVISYLILWILVLLLNLTSIILNKIATVLMIIITISFLTCIIIIVIRECYEKQAKEV